MPAKTMDGPFRVAFLAAAAVCCAREPSPRPGAAAREAIPPWTATADALPSETGDGAPGVDTLTVQAYAQFARPRHKLGVTPGGPDDFTAYSVSMSPDTFSFVVAGERYVVAPDGAALRTVGDDRPQPFFLPVTDGLYIDVLGFTRAHGDPVFVVQEKDPEGAAGFVVRMDSATLETEWIAKLPGFNVGVALQEAGRLYVTCIGFVGAVNLSTGRYVWRQDDLYETDAYDNFPPPVLLGDTLGFGRDGSHPLRLDKNTGRRMPT